MNITHQEFCAKLLLTFLSGTILMAFAVSGSAQEKIQLGTSALSPRTANGLDTERERVFKKHGLDVEILLIPSGALTSQSSASGEIGIAEDNAGAGGGRANASGSRENDHNGFSQLARVQHCRDQAGQGFDRPQESANGCNRIGSSSHGAVRHRTRSFQKPSATISPTCRAAR